MKANKINYSWQRTTNIYISSPYKRVHLFILNSLAFICRAICQSTINNKNSNNKTSPCIYSYKLEWSYNMLNTVMRLLCMLRLELVSVTACVSDIDSGCMCVLEICELSLSSKSYINNHVIIIINILECQTSHWGAYFINALYQLSSRTQIYSLSTEHSMFSIDTS